ncbi:uncharacterized protein N7483_006559 [Penicillium malachiteum]|uniref:uncharacterized protein n=1 Tax=Penicillium malachiteum TaxID=1324776 RepID=UPI002548E9B1|nr:uncharacterized protein N7483_006559 [Penicillium malachiteum]KAJ5725202.1 hypothetical protein N7483_006559 [Penicillium malachiteum]
MSDPDLPSSSATLFLEQEVYRLGTAPGFRYLPPGPVRDFILLSWGPLIYRTSYKPETKHLIHSFLRCLNDAISSSLSQLSGSDEEIKLLTQAYSSKLFSNRDIYADVGEEAVRRVFHEYKASLDIPATDLPSRLRVCLMVDDAVLSNLKAILNLSEILEKSTDIDRCWVKVIEENFPDSRFGDRPYVANVDFSDEVDGVGDYRGNYRGWTMVALSALVEVFDGLRQMKHLVRYHREGRVYLGGGKWSSI